MKIAAEELGLDKVFTEAGFDWRGDRPPDTPLDRTVVYEAHVPRPDDAGSDLTVATNGLDALRAVGADKPVLADGFPTPTNVLLSGTGRRLGAGRARPCWATGPSPAPPGR